MTEQRTDDHRAWLQGLADRRRFGPDDRRGTLNLVDDAARARALGAIGAGRPVSLSRPLAPYASFRGDGREGFTMEPFYTEVGPMGVGSDHLELDCHGIVNTHLDALNHLSVDGRTWYGGSDAGTPTADATSLVDLAGGIVTRGLYVDIAAARGTPWADAQEPVDGDEIERALAGAGIRPEPGDALLLDMGRDAYEAAGHSMVASATSPEESQRPGAGAGVAHWIADHDIAVLAWDFLDAVHPEVPLLVVHGLLWAIGLPLVDNCSFAALRPAVAPAPAAVGALVVAPLPIPGATGCNVNPLFVS